MAVFSQISFLWALLLLPILSQCATQESYYYVKPTTDTSCPADPCLTLSEYVQQPDQYLTSNATMVFLPGTHTLDNDFVVADVASFRLLGDPTSLPEVTTQVVCSGPVGFIFDSLLRLEISALAITACGTYNRDAISVFSVWQFELNNCSLYSNIAAGALTVTFSNVNIVRTGFMNNSVIYGGGVQAVSSVVIIEDCTFINNSANSSGGGIAAFYSTAIQLNGNNLFDSNQAGYVGGAIEVFANCTLRLNGNNLFKNNIGYQGGALFTFLSKVNIGGNNTFIGNEASTAMNTIYTLGGGNSVFRSRLTMIQGGAVSLAFSAIQFEGSTEFVNNSADEQGGAIHTLHSDIQVAGKVSFLYNSAPKGGGISLEYSSTLSFQLGAHALFERNTADLGAAIRVNDINLIQCLDISGLDPAVQNVAMPYCFFYIPPMNLPQIYFTFVDNSAKVLGSALYGGLLERCKVTGYEESRPSPTEIFQNISTFASGNGSTISSEPLQVCFCRNNTPDCAYEHPRLERISGQTFIVSLAALDQVDQSIPATIQAELLSSSGSNARLGDFQNIRQIEGTCTDLQYTLFSPDISEELILFAEGLCGSTRIATRSIVVEFLPCPDGFVLSNAECICEPRLQMFTSACNVSSDSVERSGTFWMGVLYENSTYKGLILHPHCPFDYCKTDDTSITLNNTDVQCAHGHSDILCGSCQSGLSIALGSSHCLANCSDAYLALILPFAALGVLLVIVILLLKLTVAIGTINGLIFYADIIAANRTIFFPPGDTNILTVFISWLNLDLGIETCFYNGMDAYAKTWLQFIFPFYLWMLLGLIIIASHFSMKISKLLGSNPVAVLATLFLLSYAKILSNVIAALSFTVLEYPNESRTVWLYDGNIRYFHGKHVPLVLFALLVLLLLFLPYTLFLLFHQWLQMKSDNRFLRWVTKPQVKAFMDAYHAPYMPKQRYWTGLLLILRCALYLVFSFNALRDPSVNLLIIATSTFGITIIVWLTGRVYENWWLDALESSFILNLGVLAVGTFHIKLAGGNQAALVYILVSIAFATFIGIVLYHIYFQLKSTKTGKRLLESIISPFHGIWTKLTENSSTAEQLEENDKGFANDGIVTSSYVELRELLLDEK